MYKTRAISSQSSFEIKGTEVFLKKDKSNPFIVDRWYAHIKGTRWPAGTNDSIEYLWVGHSMSYREAKKRLIDYRENYLYTGRTFEYLGQTGWREIVDE